ncbi:MAG TPA: hypothetical protein PKD90_06880 [Phnomibacter sp.]|nr:hypothetical protein [Phnomibacter sp.]
MLRRPLALVRAGRAAAACRDGPAALPALTTRRAPQPLSSSTTMGRLPHRVQAPVYPATWAGQEPL